LEEDGVTDSVNVRALALDCLIEIMEQDKYSHLVLREVLDKYAYLEKQERAFLTRLVEGTIERLLQMDDIIDTCSKVKVKKMKPLIRNLLRMSVYQIYYMDSVPDSAVCNEAVKLARKRGFSQLSGFVNGVLRSIARNRQPLTYPDLSRRYSVPEWIISQWEKQFGSEKTEAILKHFEGKAPITIRVNTEKNTPEELLIELREQGIAVSPVGVLPYALTIDHFDSIQRLPAFAEGKFYVQDLSSMMVAETAIPKEDDYIIDVCAAPGGKSTHLAEMLHGTGHVEARDLTDYKVGLIQENIDRHGLSNMSARRQDATVFDPESLEKADILICDLPCSGLGVIGRKKDIRYKMTPEKEKELCSLQRAILDTVYAYVKKGGSLIYSTCTIHEAENEENVRWFVQQHPEFTVISMKQLLPGDVGADGFFIAKLVRNNDGK
jgi:16S rRNA (cytosine967-C5)-methyltransferase